MYKNWDSMDSPGKFKGAPGPNRRSHLTCAFNTETDEQLNSWLNGFEAQLQHMSAVNYNFTIHTLILVYKEVVEERIEQKELGLHKEFWN